MLLVSDGKCTWPVQNPVSSSPKGSPLRGLQRIYPNLLKNRRVQQNMKVIVLWHRWFGDRKGICPVKSWALVCWWWWFDCSFASHLQLLSALPLSLAAIKSAKLGSTGKWLLKWRARLSSFFSVVILAISDTQKQVCWWFPAGIEGNLQLLFDGMVY